MTPKTRIPRVQPVEVELERTPLSPIAWAVLLASLPMLFGVWALAAQNFSMPPVGAHHDLYAGNYDNVAEAALRAGSPEMAEVDVVMLGTSREIAGLWGEDRLEEALGEKLGRPVALAALNAYRIRPMDTLFLTTLMEKPRRVIIPVNPQSFAWPQALSEHLREMNFIHSPLPFIDAYQDRIEGLEAYAGGWERLQLQMRAQRRLLRRLTHFRLDTWAAVHLYGQPANIPDPMGRRATGDRAEQASHRKNWIVRRMLVFDDNQHWNQDIYALAIERLQAAGAEVALMECAVMDTDPEETYAPWWSSYQARIRELSEEHGVRVFDFNDEVALGPDDFVDASHMGEPGRDKFSPPFVEAVARWIAETEEPNR